MIWQDGTCLGYGRGDSPNAPQYLFKRSVDYCSASLITQQLGWNPETDLLVADDPVNFAQQCVKLYQDSTLWNQLRKNAFKRVKIECSATVFSEKLDSIFNLFYIKA